MTSGTQFKLFVWYIAYLIEKYVNIEQIFWRFIPMHLNLKLVSQCHWNVVLSHRLFLLIYYVWVSFYLIHLQKQAYQGFVANSWYCNVYS